MKALVAYSSRTGNTRMIADAIAPVLPGDVETVSVECAPQTLDHDFVAIGFWVDKGVPDEQAQEFMKRLRGTVVGLFGTLGAWPDSDHARECMESAVRMMEENDNRVICRFMCQGKVDPKVVEAMARYAPERHPMTPERKARLEEAAKHPDETDTMNAAKVFSAAVKEHFALAGRP
ncbi:flavodoxin family protein [Desulfurispirillum indicum]|uniref:Flavodoxin family protein n=1 Tax=Desulfurispirillum indicum (strain ATCC BAA-1389 / DSM 22839 / S5) TaxID=653733 RepID=E6W2I9_DESIS|nr:flavodoxin family protein [Desulfurispirillum indicum]ADU66739.1 flavodoxin family protein [Desulfurispirillum indicum S5]UCZ56061.1 flavodoxin family protein [Desulfurispirillum indicum]